MAKQYKTIADLEAAATMSEDGKLKSPGVLISDCGKGILQPHVKYQWRIHFDSEVGMFSLLPKKVKSCTRPALQFEEIQTAVGENDHVYTAGKHSWLPITIDIVDNVDSSAVTQIQKQIQVQFEAFNGTSTPYKFLMHLVLVDDTNIQEVWALSGCFIQSVEYAEFTCTSDDNDETNIALVIRFDHAYML